jgi:MFS family permease
LHRIIAAALFPGKARYNARMAFPPKFRTVFQKDELTVVLGASGVYALRMLGLYMALPIMSTWSAGLPGATPFLVGLSLGAYGLTQAIFQVPAGLLGDVRGRRIVVLLSLLVFAVGCAMVALATSIHWVVAGRLVQGIGAMASTLIALIGDVTREQVRTRAMALMGGVLGVAFAGGFLLGPLVSAKLGVSAVFGVAAGLSVLGILLFELLVPRRLVPGLRGATRARAASATPPWSWSEARSLLKDRSLLVLDGGIAALHAALTGLFVVIPFVLKDHLAPLELWKVYAPVLAAGLASMVWASQHADRPARTRAVLRVGASMLTLGLFCLAFFHRTFWGAAIPLGLFVVGFAMIEPVLASLLTRFTGRTARGTAAGLFNMSQFGGAFIGGALAGLLMPLGRGVPFAALGLLTGVWALALGWLRNPEDIAKSEIEAPGLDGTTWPELRAVLVSHAAILEAEWPGGTIVIVRHWARIVSADELTELIRKRAG